MGKRGPTGTPTALKVLQGNPGKRSLNQNEPKMPISEEWETPPPWLGSYAKKEWKRVLPMLKRNGLFTGADYMALCAYCQSVDTWILAEKQKRADGMIMVSPKGYELQAPAVGIANTAMGNILKFGREFGLTPASRSNLSAEQFEEQENPLLTLMKEARNHHG